MFKKKEKTVAFDYTEIHNRINEKITSFCDMVEKHPLYETNDTFHRYAWDLLYAKQIVTEWKPNYCYHHGYVFGAPVLGDNVYKQNYWEAWEGEVDQRIKDYTERIEKYIEWYKSPNDFNLQKVRFAMFKANPLGTVCDHYMYLFEVKKCDGGWIFIGLDNTGGVQIDSCVALKEEYRFEPMAEANFFIFLSQERIRLEKAGKTITEIDEEFDRLRKEFIKQNKELKND